MAQDVNSLIDRSNISGGDGFVDRSDFTTPFGDIVTVINNTLNHIQQFDGARLKELSGNPSTPPSGNGILFAKSDGLYFIDDAGVVVGPITGIPTNTPFITRTPVASLSSETAMSALATGLVKNTTATGVPTIAVAGTDYITPIGVGVVADEQAQGVAPNTYTANSWQDVRITNFYNGSGSIITGVNTSAMTFTIVSGSMYYYSASVRIRTGASAGQYALRLTDGSGIPVKRGMWLNVAASTHAIINLSGYFTFGGTFKLQIYPTVATVTTGAAANISGEYELYTEFELFRLR